jgi:hypothetical protein
VYVNAAEDYMIIDFTNKKLRGNKWDSHKKSSLNRTMRIWRLCMERISF